MDRSNIKIVVFDCDGVLFDTAGANRKFYNIALAHFSKPELDQEQFDNVHMMTVQDGLNYLFPEMKDDFSPVYEVLRGIEFETLASEMSMAEGLVPLLEKIGKKGMLRGVATNRTDSMYQLIRDFQLTGLFEKVVTAKDVEHPKPAPDQLHLIMETFDLAPRQILFVGDSQFDMNAAKAADTLFAAFKNPSLSADLHLDSMEELGRILDV